MAKISVKSKRKDPPDKYNERITDSKGNPKKVTIKRYSTSRSSSPGSPGSSGGSPAFKSAYAKAKSEGKKEFSHGGKRFNTDEKAPSGDIKPKKESRTISYVKRKGLKDSTPKPSGNVKMSGSDKRNPPTTPPKDTPNSKKSFSNKKLKITRPKKRKSWGRGVKC